MDTSGFDPLEKGALPFSSATGTNPKRSYTRVLYLSTTTNSNNQALRPKFVVRTVLDMRYVACGERPL